MEKVLGLGGVPMAHFIDTQETPGSGGSYVDLTTVGPTLTVPLAGDYHVSFGARASGAPGVAYVWAAAVKNCAAATADAESVQVGQEELTQNIVFQAQRYGIAPEEFIQQVQQANQLPALFADIRRSKALAAVDITLDASLA